MESLLAGYRLKESFTVQNTSKANVISLLSNKFTFPASLRVKRAFSTNLSRVKENIPTNRHIFPFDILSTHLLSVVIAVSASFKLAICTMQSFYYLTRIQKMNEAMFILDSV